jgi:hypothetical protein
VGLAPDRRAPGRRQAAAGRAHRRSRRSRSDARRLCRPRVHGHGLRRGPATLPTHRPHRPPPPGRLCDRRRPHSARLGRVREPIRDTARSPLVGGTGAIRPRSLDSGVAREPAALRRIPLRRGAAIVRRRTDGADDGRSRDCDDCATMADVTADRASAPGEVVADAQAKAGAGDAGRARVHPIRSRPWEPAAGSAAPAGAPGPHRVRAWHCRPRPGPSRSHSRRQPVPGEKGAARR